MKYLIDRNQRQKKTSAVRRGLSLLALVGILPTTACATTPGDPDIAAHPTELKFSELSFTPPEAAKARSVLSNGTPVYVVEDPSLPLVDLQVMIRVGAYLVPAGKEGIAGAVGSQIRAAGDEG